MSTTPEPKKRGRKKKVIAEITSPDLTNTVESGNVVQSTNTLESSNIIESLCDTNENKPPDAPKKRGRKPKGGKILPVAKLTNSTIEKSKNVILHLKCCLQDLKQDNNFSSITAYDTINSDFEILNNHQNNMIIDNNKLDSGMYDNNCNNGGSYDNSSFDKGACAKCACDNGACDKGACDNGACAKGACDNGACDNGACDNSAYDKEHVIVNKEEVLNKINQLKINLSTNNISDKRSDCFWCTYEFHNPPIFIPKREKNDGYEVYGCFCTPECGVAYLMNEIIDSSIKFERYQLMNYIYGKSLNYNSNIKPAPDPHYLLDKYYGNLNIEEYRSTLRNNNYLIFVDKPLTHVFPEMFNDNHDFTLMKDGAMGNSLSQYKIKKASKNSKPKTKSEIVQEKFGVQ
jgi:hypothetical protein